MTEENLPLDDLKTLAEQEIASKKQDVDNEAQARELYDLPTEPAGELVDQQAEE
jgi:hypothetical protein